MHTRRTLLLLLCLATVPLTLQAKPPINQSLIRHIAIKGYDPVAYFTTGKPAKGSADFIHSWNGATWRFTSQKHRDAFAASPTTYAPQYGGYCAWAVAQGETADIDPKAWKIINGKLYLNYNDDIARKWLADADTFITKADKHWPAVLD